MLTIIFLALSAAALANAAVITTPEPTYPNGIRQCARSECPVYKELEDYGSLVTKRRIEPGLWVHREAPTCNRSLAVGSIYLSLHYYFRDNEIRRTAPIVVEAKENKVRPSFCPDHETTYPCCDELYRLSFYVPRESQATAPPPLEDSPVQLINASQPRDFYVIAFSGRVTNRVQAEKYDELVQFLKNEGLEFHEDAYLMASYDAPWRPQPHRGEVLIPMKPNKHDDQDANDNSDGEGGNDNGNGDSEGGAAGGNNDNAKANEVPESDDPPSRKRRALLDSELNIDLIPY